MPWQGIASQSDASQHALCPFGGVVTIDQYATVGTFVQKIHESSFVLMAIYLPLSKNHTMEPFITGSIVVLK